MSGSVRSRGLVGIALVLSTVPALTRADVVVPSSAYLTNGLGDDYQTDVRVLNPGSTPLLVTAVFYRQTNEAAGLPADTVTADAVAIPAGGQVAFDNVLLTLFGQPRGAYGPIRFQTASSIFVSSATNNVNGCNHTGAVQGQWIPGIDVAGAVTQGTLLQLAASTDLASGYRTNVVFFNPSDSATATVTANLRRGDGTLVSGATFPLGNGPSGFRQINRFSTDFAPPVSLTDTNLFLEFTSDQPVLSFASVINNVSGDPYALTPATDLAVTAGVTSLNTLVGAVTLEGASGVAIARSGQTLTIAGPTALPPTGPAGGALTGTYPNPGLAGGPFASLAANTFSGTQTIGGGNLALSTTTGPTAGVLTLGGRSFLHAFGSVSNTFVGTEAGGAFATTGDANSAFGAFALRENTTGIENAAFGTQSLQENTTGISNSAFGAFSLNANTTGSNNAAFGDNSLSANTTGGQNAAFGAASLLASTTGGQNSAFGTGSLQTNSTGASNSAFGALSLSGNAAGDSNSAFGALSLRNTSGSGNIGIGRNAGGSLTTGDNNIDVGNTGIAGESGAIRIGTDGTHTRAFIAGIRGVQTASSAVPVLIDSNGQLGTASSSRRFKVNIADMDAASSALMRLRPVTFHYTSDPSPSEGTLQYGLIAEEVAEVYPGLVARSADGQVETVLYQFLPPMLLNEVQKLHRTIEAQEAEIDRLGARLAESDGVRARLKQLEERLERAEARLAESR
jgi:hypothetical protein